jgi:uroporphyrinogen decarboxylase
LEYLQRQAEELYTTTDYGILGAFGGGVFEVGQGDFGFETYFYNLAMEPKLIHYYNERLCTAHLHDLKKYLAAVGEYIDVIQFGDDLGMQTSLQISVEMYREMIKPYQSELYSYVKKNYPHVKVFLHSCGAIVPLLPDLIDVGVEVINPVQLSAAGMDGRMLKREFGEALTFWGGGVSTQTTLVTGTAEEVANSVKENMQIFAPGGGFVFTQDHNIQADIPPEKVMAIYGTAVGCRSYEN